MLQRPLEELSYRLLPRVEPGRVLSRGEWKVLVRAAEVLVGDAGFIAPSEVADNVERFLATGRSKRAWRCRVLLHALELSTLATHGRTFTQLSRVERRELAGRHLVTGGGLWRLLAKVRYLVLMGAYGDRRAPAATGYVPAPERPRLRRRLAITKAQHEAAS